MSSVQIIFLRCEHSGLSWIFEKKKHSFEHSYGENFYAGNIFYTTNFSVRRNFSTAKIPTAKFLVTHLFCSVVVGTFEWKVALRGIGDDQGAPRKKPVLTKKNIKLVCETSYQNKKHFHINVSRKKKQLLTCLLFYLTVRSVQL